MLPSKLKDSITGPDDAYEIMLIGVLVALVIGFGLQIFVVVIKSAAFSFVDFGAGVGSLLGGAGFGYGMKKLGERTNETNVPVPTITV